MTTPEPAAPVLSYSTPALKAALAPRPRARRVKYATWAFILTSGIVLPGMYLAPVYTERVYAGVAPSAGDLFVGLYLCGAGTLQLAAVVCTVVMACMWMHRANRTARWLGTAGMRFTPGWAVGWWFIPLVNLWQAPRIVAELWRASDPGLPPGGDCRGSALSPLVAVWSILWMGLLLTMWMDNIITSLGGSRMAAAGANLFNLLLNSITAVVLVVLVGRITRRLEKRLDLAGQGTVIPPTPAAP